MGDWVERPWTAERPDHLDTVWRSALVSHGVQFSPGNPAVFVPSWKRDKRRKAEEKERLLLDSGSGVTVLERSHTGEFSQYQIEYRTSVLVEEGVALLYGWIELWWELNGILRKIRLEFNSSEMPRLRRFTRAILDRWGIRFGTPESPYDPLLGQGQPDRDRYRQILDYNLGNDESVEMLLYQPRVYSLKGSLRKRKYVAISQQMAVHTPFRWILLADHDRGQDLEYGTRIVSLRSPSWHLTAPNSDTLEWSIVRGDQGYVVRLFFPKRAAHFLEGSPGARCER